MEKEIWKDIEGYEGRYRVDTNGAILRLQRVVRAGTGYRLLPESIRKSHIDKHGYSKVILFNGKTKKNIFIHRIVASAFVPKITGKNIVNHKDGNKLNNNHLNLEWCTVQENTIHAYANNLIKTKKVDVTAK